MHTAGRKTTTRKQVAAKRTTAPKRAAARGGTARKMAISFDRKLAAEVIHMAKERAGGNVSAWLAEAAREQLRHQNGVAALEAYEAELGRITDEERAEGERLWSQG